MEDEAFKIRTMRREEMDLAVDWAAAEGWNPGLDDARCFHAADPEGFLIGLLDEMPVATISAVRYGEDFGFLGFYIVKAEYRGRGCGLRIWNAALKRLEGRTVGLDGVVEQQHNYRKSGFKLACRNVRYEGRGGGVAATPAGIVDLASLPLEVIGAYDRRFFPAERTAFLKCWIQREDGRALGLMTDGSLEGYGVLRRCRSGFKIGPLFADHPEAAEKLYQALIAGLDPADPVFLDVPEPNHQAFAMVERHHMRSVFETSRMYKGGEPVLPLERIFGVTSFELG